MLSQDAFGITTEFVGFANFRHLFADPLYLDSFRTTIVFSSLVTTVGLVVSLFLAAMADRISRGKLVYRTLLIWPYAVAPAIAAVLWAFLFNPSIGIVTFALSKVGITWNHALNGTQAMTCNRAVAQGWEQFSVEDAGGGKIALKSQGKYLSSENGAAPITCNRTSVGDWEKFDWIVNNDGSISLRGNNGRYVSCENGTQPMTCNRTAISGWEAFRY